MITKLAILIKGNYVIILDLINGVTFKLQISIGAILIQQIDLNAKACGKDIISQMIQPI